LAGLLLAVSVGCQQRVASQLLGRWEGRADTAAARAAREAEKYGEAFTDRVNEVPAGDSLSGKGLSGKGSVGKGSVGNDSSNKISVGQESASTEVVGTEVVGAEAVGAESAGKGGLPADVTDWESYDVTILIDFVSTQQVELSLDGEQPQSGSWKIISTSPTGCAIEVQTETGNASTEQPTVERRRFELLLDQREGTCIGFLLTEAGADRQQGAIYFQRPRSGDAARKH
jgi:hypothetical protein